MALGVRCDLAHAGRSPQQANIKAARTHRETLVQQDQAKQQNETANRQIDCDFPGRCDAISTAPDSDQQKRGDQCQFVKCIKEKQIDRRKCADGTARNEQETCIKGVFILVDRPCEPDRRQSDNTGKQHHD